MKVKRKVAALLALAMVVTGQPSGVLADGLNTLGTSYAAENSDAATESEATDESEATPSEIVKNPVEYIIEPEEGASIVKGSKIVKTGGELTFTVEVNDGYELDSVDVDGDLVEPAKVDENEYSYSYQVGDILFEDHSTEVTVTLNEVEEVPFSDTITTADGLFEFEITADAGVLPEGTEVQVISLADEDEAYADQIKEEVLAEAKVEEEAEPQYAAYRIEFVNEDREALSDDEINGKVEVSVAMVEDEEAELAVYKVEGEATEAVEETPATYGLAAPRRVAARNSVERDFKLKEVSGTTFAIDGNSEIALYAEPYPWEDVTEVEVLPGTTANISLGSRFWTAVAEAVGTWTISDDLPENVTADIGHTGFLDLVPYLQIQTTEDATEGFYVEVVYKFLGVFDISAWYHITIVSPENNVQIVPYVQTTESVDAETQEFFGWTTLTVERDNKAGQKVENHLDVVLQEVESQEDYEKPEGYDVVWYIDEDRNGYTENDKSFTTEEINRIAQDTTIKTISVYGVYVPNESQWGTVTFEAGENGSLIGADLSQSGLVGETFAEAGITIPRPQPNEGYTFYRWEESKPTEETMIQEGTTTYTALFSEKTTGEDGEEIPTDAAAEVTFKTVNGYFNGTEDNTKTITVGLKDSEGQWSAEGSYELQSKDVPGVGEAPEAGYQKNGSWDKDPVGESVGKAGATYTYTYTKDESQWGTVTFEAGENGSLIGADLSQSGLVGETFAEAGITIPRPQPNEGYTFYRWEESKPTEETMIQEGTTTYTALFSEKTTGEDGEEIPTDAAAEVTFKTVNGYFNGTEDNTKTITVGLKDSEGQWSAEGSYELQSKDVPGVGEAPEAGYQKNGSWDKDPVGESVGKAGATYTYTYTKDESQWVSVIFHSDYGFENEPGNMVTLSNQLVGTPLAVPTPLDTDKDEVIFVTWNPEIPTDKLVPEGGGEYTAVYEDDKNNDGTADTKQIRITFDLGSNYEATFNEDLASPSQVTLSDDETKLTFWFNPDDNPIYPAAPTKEGIQLDSENLKVAFDGWFSEGTEYALAGQPIDSTLAGKEVVYTAAYAEDLDGDGTPDKDQDAEIKLSPYETHIYVGGSNDLNDSGLPNLDLHLETANADRPVNKDNVTSIMIDGVTQKSTDIDTYFRAVYWDPVNEILIDSDNHTDVGEYTAVVALTDNVVLPQTNGIALFAAGEEQNDGLLRVNGVVQLARDYNIEINDLKADFSESSKLVIRSVSDEEAAKSGELYRTIQRTAVTGTSEYAQAYIAPDSEFYINDVEDGRKINNTDGIRMLVDNVLPPTEGDSEDRIALLKEKANEKLGLNMTAEEAEAQGWNYELKYLDLVDANNGNAWVSSTWGTDVYWPYPEETDKNTEFRMLHFEDLHREYGLTGEAVIDAIRNGNVEDMAITPDENGILFHTDVSGFSPFALVWQTDDGNGNGGNDNPGDGSHDNDSTTGGSGTVADPYVVRLHGNWVHMDPNDIFKPISEPVPEGATPVTNPEWHQWKFILNNGTMLFNRWAYIRNPYAVGDQPREGWFYFNRDGIMQYGWYRDEATGKWYYAHRESDGMLGTLRYGWHHDDQDGRWYYLDPTTGEMLLGWRQIDGKWYYFNPYAPEVTWNYNEATGGWTYNGSTSRPYGSMYQNEMTPDGYQVDENGAWVQ